MRYKNMNNKKQKKYYKTMFIKTILGFISIVILIIMCIEKF